MCVIKRIRLIRVFTSPLKWKIVKGYFFWIVSERFFKILSFYERIPFKVRNIKASETHFLPEYIWFSLFKFFHIRPVVSENKCLSLNWTELNWIRPYIFVTKRTVAGTQNFSNLMENTSNIMFTWRNNQLRKNKAFSG